MEIICYHPLYPLIQNPASAIPPLTDPETRLAKKRKCYYDDESSEEDDEDVELDKFINKTFCQCLPKQKCFELAREYPKTSSAAVAVPTLDFDKGALGKGSARKKVMLRWLKYKLQSLLCVPHWPIFGHT